MAVKQRTRADLNKRLAGKYPSEPYNSNNAWGFGGASGEMYSVGDARIMLGAAYFRHLPSCPATTYQDDSMRHKETDDDAVFLAHKKLDEVEAK